MRPNFRFDYTRHFKLLRDQPQLNELIFYPDIKSSIDFTRGILFTNRMTILYKNESGEEEHVELSEVDDRFYSKLGIVFLEQYLKFGMNFWYYNKEKGESELKPYTPGLNGIIQGYIDDDNKMKVGWFKFVDMHIEMEPDPNVIFWVQDEPDMLKLQFRSKLRPLINSVYRVQLLNDNITDLELRKRDPGYYLQNTQLPGYGEQTQNIYNTHMELYRDNKDKQDICEDETDIFQISDPLNEHHRTLYVQGATSQADDCDEQLMIPLENDKYVKSEGIPFFKHKRVITRDVNNPKKLKHVMKFGSSIEPKFLATREGNPKIFELMKNELKDKINKVFGLSPIKNFDNTKNGSLLLVQTLNESINNLKESVEEMLTICITTLLKSKHKEKIKLFRKEKEFVGVKIHPRRVTQDSIVTQLIKIYGPTRPDIVNELLQKTSISKLDTLDEMSKELKKVGERPVPKNKEGNDEDKEESVKQTGKKRKLNSDQNYNNPIKYFSTCSDMLKRYKSCKFKWGDKLRIVDENRTYLNDKFFELKATVCDEYEVINIWNEPKLWNNPVVMDYVSNTKPNYEVLYVGLVDEKKVIVSQENLVKCNQI